ncbi:thiosulfate sulfurtransferase ynjE [Klebsiella pneumoniae]|uniref:Sulfurtransferase n=1 Tax=Klebsiella pneumoniae TaxID=573 RepID=A0A377XQX0_KLEPN|nr:thiosulfate sulfurtransferase ynjE [Klebsiella pneumoniae]
MFEAAWGAPKLYLLSHIPGAGYIDTNEVESEPLWNKVSDAQLKAMLAKHGIRHDTTVILYGRDVYAAARVAQIMLYAGVKDVRLLDGGWQTWSDAGLPVERGMPPAQQPAPDFGAPIPGQPQLMLDTEQARGLLHRQDASLVSVRSWPEFIGTTSGYSYIKPKGDIAGARWGHAGSDSTHMEDFHNPDGTMRSADDIAALWRQWNILPSQQVAFYCGTGWRASETFMYARAMGWPHVAVYDGGWYEWSSNPHNPVARGERGPGKQSVTRPASARRPLSATRDTPFTLWSLPALRSGSHCRCASPSSASTARQTATPARRNAPETGSRGQTTGWSPSPLSVPRDSTAIYGRSRDWRSGAWPPGRQKRESCCRCR